MIDKEVLEDVLDSLSNYKSQPAIETGFYDLDDFLKGAKKSSLVVIGARPAMGKTSFATNVMLNLLQNKKKCLLFSLEMSQEMVVKRLIVQDGEIDSFLIRRPEKLQQKHWKKVAKSLDSLSEYDLTIDDTCCITIEEIRKKIEAEKPEYVFIDYLQLIYTTDEKSRADGIAEIMTKLKQIAKENNCMIFVLSQISRAVENRIDRRPLLSDLRECGAIEEVADIVIFIYREEYYKQLEDDYFKNRAEIIVAKNKMGCAGTANLIFKGQFLKYFNPVKTDVF